MSIPSATATAISDAYQVLIIDDDDLVRSHLEIVLETNGISVLSVGTLHEARAAMAAVHFPLILLDRRMGEEDGLQLCIDHRKRYPNQRVAILLLSSLDTPADVLVGLAAGADEYLSKAGTDAELVRHVRLHLSRHTSAGAERGRFQQAANRANEPTNESQRLQALKSYAVLDTLREQAYDDITFLAARLLSTPMALISLVDESRQWFKSKIGLQAPQTSREVSFCAHALTKPDSLLIVNDASVDDRFRNNPLVTGEPHIRSYAGAPLVTHDGFVLGTLCVLDQRARSFDEESQKALSALGRQVIVLLEQRRTKMSLERAMTELGRADVEIRRSEALFRGVYENAYVGTALVSPSGEWLRVNRSLCDLLGYAEQELQTTTFQAVTHPDDLSADLEQMRSVLSGSLRSYEMEKRYIHKNGSVVSALLSVSLVRSESRVPLYFIAHIQDISRRRRA